MLSGQNRLVVIETQMYLSYCAKQSLSWYTDGINPRKIITQATEAPHHNSPAHHAPSFLSLSAPKARDGRYCNAPVHLSVRPSVTFSFRTVTWKRIDVFSWNFVGTYMQHVMGVCCIVFDIDGMLFEFFMNFLNIEKKKFIRKKKCSI